MSLFTVNRYEGEKGEDLVNDKKHLSDLLKQIEDRKRQRAWDKQKQQELVIKRKKRHKNTVGNEIAVEEESAVRNIFTITEINDSNKLENDLKNKRKKKKGVKDETQNENAIKENGDTSNNQNGVETQAGNGEINVSDKTKIEKEDPKQNDFLVLGTNTKKKIKEVRRVLPYWLAHPEIIPVDLTSGPTLDKFEDKLDDKLIQILKSNGIDKLFPVQATMISWLLKCNEDRKQGWWVKDTCVSAPTGSGKTLAYVLPVVQELQNRLVPKIRCLVVVPVQELAMQVYKVMTTYTSHTNLHVGLISGAYSFEQEKNNIIKKSISETFISKVDIVVATPGRLIDHILKTPGFSLENLRFLIIDEADRSAEWLQYIPDPHYHVPPLNLKNLRCRKAPAQKLLFSATLSQDPEKLNRLGLFQPILFTSVVISDKDGDVNLDKEVDHFLGRYTSPEELHERAVECSSEYKPVALYNLLIKDGDIKKTLIFTNSGDTAHRLAILLQCFLSDNNAAVVNELSAHLIPKQRESILKKFANGDVQILVSSDALARGVDIPDVQFVISYDLPKHIKGYIHRAGRTGRAGKPGTAVSVLTSHQVKLFKHMLANSQHKVPEVEKPDLESIASMINYPDHIMQLKEILERERRENLERIKTAKRGQTSRA